MASAETQEKRIQNNPELHYILHKRIFEQKWKAVPKVDVPGAPMTHMECYESLPCLWKEIVLNQDFEKLKEHFKGEFWIALKRLAGDFKNG